MPAKSATGPRTSKNPDVEYASRYERLAAVLSRSSATLGTLRTSKLIA
jgi:hypothetical protein